jgi:transposase-like protein
MYSAGMRAIMNQFKQEKESIMSLTKTWYSVEEAAAKFGLNPALIYEWVEAGLVRAEEEKQRVVQVNGDDIERELQIVPSV